MKKGIPTYSILSKLNLPKSIILYILKNFLYKEKIYLKEMEKSYDLIREHYDIESQYLYNILKEHLLREYNINNYNLFKNYFIDFTTVVTKFKDNNSNQNSFNTTIKVDSTKSLITELHYINTINNYHPLNQLHYFELHDNINSYVNYLLTINNISEKKINNMNIHDKIDMIIKF